MPQFPVHTIASAPAPSRSLFEGYLSLTQLFSQTAFSPPEQQLVLLAASRRNSCSYCVAAHTVIAGMEGLDPVFIEAIRAGTPIPDSRLEALRQFTQDVIASGGWLEEEQVERFLAAGYSEGQCLDVIVGIALKTLSNYSNHLAATPLDSAFATASWGEGHADH